MSFYTQRWNDGSTSTYLPGFQVMTPTSNRYGWLANASGYAYTDSTGTAPALCTTPPTSVDQFALVTLVNNTGNSSGVMVRQVYENTGVVVSGFIFRHTATDIALQSLKTDGTSTALGNATINRVAGQRLLITARGTTTTTINGYIIGPAENLADVIDTVIAGTRTPTLTATSTDWNRVGTVGFRSAGVEQVYFDDFVGGDWADIGQAPASLGITSGAALPQGTPTLTLGTPGSTSVALGWSGVTGATAWRVEYKLASASTWTTATSTATGSSYTITGLAPASAYNFRVTPVNGNGDGTTSSTQSATTAAASDETVNESPADGIPRYKGIVWGPSGRIILPGKRLYARSVDAFGASGAFTPPAAFSVVDGTATVSSGLGLLQLATAATTGAKATLALAPDIDLAAYAAVKIDIEAMSFASGSPSTILRVGAVGATDATLGGGVIQRSDSSEMAARLHSNGETSVTRGAFSHLGATANQRRQMSVLIVPGAGETFMLEDDELLLWRRDANFKTGTVRVRLQIENLAAVATTIRLARMDVTLYA